MPSYWVILLAIPHAVLAIRCWQLSQVLGPRCTKIALHRAGIGDEGAEQVAIALQRNRNITNVVLSANLIGDQGIGPIAKALHRHPAVRIWWINDNDIGDQGGIAIADALIYNQVIEAVDVSANQLGDLAAACLLRVVEMNPRITQLDIADNPHASVPLLKLVELQGQLNLHTSLPSVNHTLIDELVGLRATLTQYVEDMSELRFARKRYPASSSPSSSRHTSAPSPDLAFKGRPRVHIRKLNNTADRGENIQSSNVFNSTEHADVVHSATSGPAGLSADGPEGLSTHGPPVSADGPTPKHGGVNRAAPMLREASLSDNTKRIVDPPRPPKHGYNTQPATDTDSIRSVTKPADAPHTVTPLDSTPSTQASIMHILKQGRMDRRKQHAQSLHIVVTSPPTTSDNLFILLGVLCVVVLCGVATTLREWILSAKSHAV